MATCLAIIDPNPAKATEEFGRLLKTCGWIVLAASYCYDEVLKGQKC